MQAPTQDPDSRRARQYHQLHTQLERLQRNIENLKANSEAAAEQVDATRRLGIVHASMFMAAGKVMPHAALHQSSPPPSSSSAAAAPPS
ncbi:hypothetical protein THASP1DRAFT_31154 [Thamnocephalis sphaerospora]|uniref:DASH complex subunit Hsk3 like-domain-containing protein n=1 Tax=Thamnocephalis sphaerospora TaxID=78915 RepID=A0A4P9XM92_9FUNG|nr:hypothetical protein THASP1DRAFT_31154 [Thamnocephalis sphaerospora]|eukprot:RKP07027.1 hypothetical protein THASP1DRAFT_31154 [Thamnocephalis sphaerospora]